MRANNLTLLTDLYELTMMQGYFKNPTDQTVVFDMFYRDNPCGGGFAICAGLEQMIEYIENLRFSEEDITYLLEHINAGAPFTLDKDQILVGTHGQYTPAIGAALYYVEKFIQSV